MRKLLPVIEVTLDECCQCCHHFTVFDWIEAWRCYQRLGLMEIVCVGLIMDGVMCSTNC